MSLGGGLLTLLFIFRFIRWNIFTGHTFYNRLMWYGYYIPILITPLLSLMISLAIGGKFREKRGWYLLPLKLVCALLLILVLTNDLHGLVIRIWYEDGRELSSGGPLYYLFFFWYILLMLTAFTIAYRKCMLSSYRKHWIIPLSVELFGFLLWFWYYVVNNGSSPKFNGYSLYNIQEVYVLLFIGFWESLILIGLIPSVSLAKDRAWISEGILVTVSDEIEEIRDILERIREAEDEVFRRGIIRIAFIGAYIKRRANLELITSENNLLSTAELSLAIREALDYFDFSRISAGFEESGESVEVPSLLISGIFELLKNVIYRTVSACYVKLVTGRTEGSVTVTMTIEADMEPAGLTDRNRPDCDRPDSLADMELFDALGATLYMREEDDTWKLTLNASYPVLKKDTSRGSSLYGRTGYGLSQITSYLSLEKEALLTKTRIHDGLGRCLLITKAYLLGSDTITREAVLSEWDRVLAEMSETEPAARLSGIDRTGRDYFISQAESMGVDAVISGDIPDDRSLRDIFNTAFTVHITNVLKHTGGRKAYIDISASDTAYVLTFTDDDAYLGGEIVEKGGLKNLRQRTEDMGGTMVIEWKHGFKIILTLPKDGK